MAKDKSYVQRVMGVIVDDGKVSSSGDVIDIKGLKLPKDVPVTVEFNPMWKIGFAENIRIVDGKVVADVIIRAPIEHKEFFPAYKVIKSIMEERKEGSVRVLKKSELIELAVKQVKTKAQGE